MEHAVGLRGQTLRRQRQQAAGAGDRLQTAVIAAVALLTVGIDLSMSNLHQRPPAFVQQLTAANHACADSVVNHNLDHVLRAARRAEQRLRQRPGGDVVLNENRHAGALRQRIAQRYLARIVARQPVHHARGGVN